MAASPPTERLRISARSAVLAVAVLGLTLLLLRVLIAAQRPIGWILVAATLAGILSPGVARLDRVMPRGLAVALVMLAFVGATAGVVYGLVDEIQQETKVLQRVAPREAAELERSERWGELARDLDLAERTRRFADDIPERLRGGTTAEALQAAATRGVAFLATGVLTIFLLLHGARIAAAARQQIADEDRRRRAERLALNVYRRAFGYARGRLAMATVAGLFAYGVAVVADLPGDAPLGLWVGLWDIVPVVGAFVGAAPIVFLAAATLSGSWVVAVVGLFAVYQATETLVVQPRLEARTLHLGPFLTLAAALVGLELSGVAGALLLVLVAAVAVAAADELAAP
jgi:predicted PurR-regulated permease PerM